MTRWLPTFRALWAAATKRALQPAKQHLCRRQVQQPTRDAACRRQQKRGGLPCLAAVAARSACTEPGVPGAAGAAQMFGLNFCQPVEQLVLSRAWRKAVVSQFLWESRSQVLESWEDITVT